MIGECIAEATRSCEPEFQPLPGSVIEQCRRTALTRIPAHVVKPTKLDILGHLMPVVIIRRQPGDPRAGLLVYLRCQQQDVWVYVHSYDDERLDGEPISKPKDFCLEAELAAEAQAAEELVDPRLANERMVCV